jgi:hypothetical protein
MRAISFVVGTALGLLPSWAFAQAVLPRGDNDYFDNKIRAVLTTHCYECHSKAAAKVKGDFRLDKLSPDFPDTASRDAWQNVLKRV